MVRLKPISQKRWAGNSTKFRRGLVKLKTRYSLAYDLVIKKHVSTEEPSIFLCESVHVSLRIHLNFQVGNELDRVTDDLLSAVEPTSGQCSPAAFDAIKSALKRGKIESDENSSSSEIARSQNAEVSTGRGRFMPGRMLCLLDTNVKLRYAVQVFER